MIKKKQTVTVFKNQEPQLQGESLMQKLRRMTEEKEPIGNEVQLIYTDKGDGVMPGYDIRTDRFEVGREAMEKVKASQKKERAEQKAVLEPKTQEITNE